MKKLLLLCLCSSVFGGSVYLVNDSAYTLRATIRAADGSQLGQVLLPAQKSQTWADDYQTSGPNPSRSLTPYTVVWTCPSGDEFSVCPGVITGSGVTALSCSGTRYCKPPKKKEEKK